ncbi:meiotic recombination protein SPO11-like isoform X2 [Tigriopus californicus]|uniref:meiotic recombination protein SPO11-like isoform X2 n=1 Tax=Tigriopus californicus TaxID=6832 RepID=UPI0027DA8CB5|nr:meiotic recombination protein SPO11-like isoform X2 [Tigriopus californicus]
MMIQCNSPIPLKRFLMLTHFPPMVCPWTFMSHEERYQRVVGQIEGLLLSQIQNGMVQGDAPLGFTYPDYSDWSQVQYHPGYGLRPNLSASRMITTRLENRGSATKYSLIVLTLWSILELFDQDSFVTKRELYYQHINHYRSQVAVDECVKVIACMLRIPRLHLRILSTSKGLFMGNIVFHNAQGIQVIGSHATPIPQDITGISQLASDAKFILVVEKDAVFQRLADDNFAVIYQPCLVITGKGVPDLNTRQFLYHLWTHLKIPVLALMDGDPFGLEILCTYRFGSLPMTWSQELLPVPIMKWIGIFPSDIHQFSREHLKPLSKVDCAKIRSLLQRPYVEAHPELKQEILIMKDHGWKAEIEAVDSVGDFVIRQILSQHWR